MTSMAMQSYLRRSSHRPRSSVTCISLYLLYSISWHRKNSLKHSLSKIFPHRIPFFSRASPKIHPDQPNPKSHSRIWLTFVKVTLQLGHPWAAQISSVYGHSGRHHGRLCFWGWSEHIILQMKYSLTHVLANYTKYTYCISSA